MKKNEISTALDPLVDVSDINNNIVLDIRYATDNNFTKKIIYKSDKCLVHKDVSIALDRIQKHLEKLGLGLKIFDGYRPIWAQQILFDTFPDERYVGNPKKITRHTRGTAVDVTLINLVDRSELEMPTGFDSFSEKAHLVFEDLSESIKKNRKLLQDAMINIGGFEPLPTEWWHFDLEGWQEYPVLGIKLI
ncbi:MAG: D-alanyl-D-alanine dipeptidase [Candidatus Anoxychlamydiales bacterium]|nr:D-alanyl-D-alanine dipeptidase [Candidatus Anoxychlamydiales bacterium]